MRFSIRGWLACAVAALVFPVRATDRTWNGNIFGNQYTNSANWSGFIAPSGSGDRAFFTNSAAIYSTVTFDSNPTIGTAVVSGNNTAGNYNFVESGDRTWTITDQFQINNNTGLTNASIAGLTVNAGSVTLLGINTLSLNSAAVLSSTGSLQLGLSTINIDSTSRLTAGSIHSAGGGRINASGTLAMLGSSTFNFSTITLNSAGTISLSAATLNLGAGGFLQLNRDWHVRDNSTLRVVDGGDAYVGSGQYLDVGFSSTGTLRVDGAGSTIIGDPGSIGAYWGVGGNAVVSFTNGGAGTFTYLDIGTSDGQAAVDVFSSSTLRVGTVVLGGTVNSAVVKVAGGTMTLGACTINPGGRIQIGDDTNPGTLNLNDSLTINAGGMVQLRAPIVSQLNIASGKSININGGSLHLMTGHSLSPGATISIAGGTLQADSFLNIGANGAGTLLASGTMSMVTVAGLSEIGKNTHAGTVIFKNGAAGTFSNGVILGSNGTGRLDLFTEVPQVVSTTVTFSGGTSYVRLSGSQLNIGTLGALNLNENLTVELGGQLNFGAGATALNVASGKRILITNGGVANFNQDYGVSAGSGFLVSNGTLNANDNYFDIGNGGAGTLSVSGSSARMMSGNLSYWGYDTGGNATIDFSDSSVGTLSELQLGHAGGQGVLNVNSGAILNLTDHGTFGGGSSPHSATVNITSASFLSNGTANFLDGSTLTLNSGTANFNHLKVESGARLNYIDGLMTASTLTMTGGEIILGGAPIVALGVGTLNLSGGTIDIQGDGMVVNTLHTPLSTLRGYLAAGRIKDSSADGIHVKLAYQMNPGIPDFYGVPADANSAFIARGVVGDTDLDYKVTTVDFNNLAGHFGTGSNNFWEDGDFDYNGLVNSLDFTALAGNYGYNLFPAPTLGSVVPEPVGIGAGLCGMLLLNRRRS